MRYSGITTETVVIQRNFSLYWTICHPGKLQTAACQPVLSLVLTLFTFTRAVRYITSSLLDIKFNSVHI